MSNPAGYAPRRTDHEIYIRADRAKITKPGRLRKKNAWQVFGLSYATLNLNRNGVTFFRNTNLIEKDFSKHLLFMAIP